MEKGFTQDPNVALTGLISIALLGVLVIGGGLVVSGFVEGAWIRIVGGAVLLTGLSWMVWQAGRVVRKGLINLIVKRGSGETGRSAT